MVRARTMYALTEIHFFLLFSTKTVLYFSIIRNSFKNPIPAHNLSRPDEDWKRPPSILHRYITVALTKMPPICPISPISAITRISLSHSQLELILNFSPSLQNCQYPTPLTYFIYYIDYEK